MRVLLIDDDALVRLTLTDTLAAEGIEMDGLANAEDALVLLGAGQVPDVLVADIDLGPGLSGLDLAAIARARHPAAEVVLISGTAPDPGLLGCRERFLRKPFAPAALAEAIRGTAAAATAKGGGQRPPERETAHPPAARAWAPRRSGLPRTPFPDRGWSRRFTPP